MAKAGEKEPDPPVADPNTQLALLKARQLAPDKRLKPLMAVFDGDLDQKQRKYLAAIAKYGGIRIASFKANLPTSYHYHWLIRSKDYETNYLRARQMYGDTAESAIMQRGIEGHLKPLSYKGKLTGDAILEHSDVLAAMIIKALKPEYRDGAQIAVGPAKIEISITQAEQVSSEQNTIIVNKPG